MVMANLGCITHGATMIYPTEGFEPLAVLETVQEERCTALYIAHYKIPRYIKFVGSFPMTVTGKIQKFHMREQSTTELGLHSAASIETA
jgi:acyl-CoA synthetase (AMP-forming)/AMP-acid ligase II